MKKHEIMNLVVESQKSEIELLKNEIRRLSAAPAAPMINRLGKTDWATADVATLKRLLEDHYAGKLSIYDYMDIGDEREVSLGGEIDQTVQLVLTDKKHYTMIDGVPCAFTVDQKNLLKDIELPIYECCGKKNTWADSDIREWLHGDYANAFPSDLLEIFKRFIINLPGGDVTNDLFTLRSEVELFGKHIYSDPEELGSQIEYYKITRNRVKCLGNDAGSANYWWERSPRYSDSRSFCFVNSGGNANYAAASAALGLAPAGCI